MTENRVDLLTSVEISITQDGEPGFHLLITKEGTVQRTGYSALKNDEKTEAVADDPSVFQRYIDGLPTDVLEHTGSHAAESGAGEKVVCRIELVGASGAAAYEMTYFSESGGLSRYMRLMIDLGEELTDEWYGGNLTLTPVLDLPPIQQAPPSAPPPIPEYTPPEASYQPPPEPVYQPPPEPAYEPPPEPVYQPPGEAAPEPEEQPEEEVEAEPEPEEAAPPPPSRARPRGRPKASYQRLALAVALDLVLISSAYGLLTLMTGPLLPTGLAVFFLLLLEFSLIQFVRKSPGYIMLDMRAEVGAFPTVDPDQKAGESLVTHIVASVLLILGLQSLTAWTQYEDPIPYFGFGWGMWFAVIVSLLIGSAFLVSSLFVFRNEILGVWVASGATAFGFLSVWFARGDDLNGWLRLELMRQAEAEGRPVLNPLDLDPVLDMVIPVAFVITIGCGVGLYFTWKQFTQPQAPPAVAKKAEGS